MESYLHVTSRVILLVLVVAYSSGQPASTEWTSTPTTTVQACTGQNITFKWEFRTDEEIQVLFWGRPSTGEFNLVFYYDDEEQEIAGKMNDRIHVLEHSLDTIEFLLVNISKDDEGKYQLLVAGPGLRNEIDLQVYDDFELEPSIAITNRPYLQDSPFNFTLGDDVILAVATILDFFQANITIQTSDTVVQRCIDQSICTCALTDQTEVEVLVDYGFCEPPPSLVQITWLQSHMYNIVQREGQEGDVTGAWSEETTTKGAKLSGSYLVVPIITTVLVFLFLAIVVVCIVFIFLRRKLGEKRTLPVRAANDSLPQVEGDVADEETIRIPLLPEATEALLNQENVQKYGEETETLPNGRRQ